MDHCHNFYTPSSASSISKTSRALSSQWIESDELAEYADLDDLMNNLLLSESECVTNIHRINENCACDSRTMREWRGHADHGVFSLELVEI